MSLTVLPVESSVDMCVQPMPTQTGERAVPDCLYIEPVNICNANCVFCSYQFDQRPKHTMSAAIFRRAVDEYAEAGGREVALSPYAGEIFIDKAIMEKIAYLSEKGFERIHTYSNATLIDRFGAHNVMRSGLTSLHISTAPLDEKVFKAIYRHPAYKRTLRNIRDLLISFGEVQDRTVQEFAIEFRSERSLQDCQALPDYKEYIEPYVTPGVSFGALTHFDSRGGLIRPSDLPPGMTVGDGGSVGLTPCSRIFILQMLVNGDLRLCGCNFDYRASVDELGLGNVDEVSLIDAFNSPRARWLKSSFEAERAPRICQDCAWYGL